MGAKLRKKTKGGGSVDLELTEQETQELKRRALKEEMGEDEENEDREELNFNPQSDIERVQAAMSAVTF